MLRDILRNAWTLLSRAAADERSPARTPVLATVGLDGSPSARTVVLRRVDPDARALFVNTDLRSPKRREIERDPRATFVFYAPDASIQLRVGTEIRIHVDDAVTAAAWRALPFDARASYATTAPPGVPTASPVTHTEADVEAGYANFCVLEATAVRLDWLDVSRPVHPRAGFSWGPGGELQASWLYP